MKRVTIFVGMVLAVLMLCIGCAAADSGTYDNISWDLTDGVLTLGVEGETQVSTLQTYRTYSLWPWNEFRADITSVVCKGTVKFRGSLQEMFYNCTNLISVDLTGFDTSDVTSMTSMFMSCHSLQSLDLSTFNTSNVTSMAATFRECVVLTDVNLTGWDTSKVTTMYRMFANCTRLASVGVNLFDTSLLTNAAEMFYQCSALTGVDLSNWYVGRVTTFESMFQECTSMSTFVSFNGSVLGNANKLSKMFYKCSALTSLNLPNWRIINVNSIQSMFNGCSSLADIDVSGWQIQYLRNAETAFAGCSSLRSIDLSDWNMGNVTSFSNMFSGAGLESVNLSGWDVHSVITVHHMFMECPNLVSANLSGWNVASLTQIQSLFQGCAKLESVDLSNWTNMDKLTDMYRTFAWCSKLTNVTLDGWTMSDVTYVGEMFMNCSALVTLDVSDWTMSSVTNMSGLFSGCSSLENIDVSNWDVASVINGKDVFRNCRRLASLDLSRWNTGNMTNISNMFRQCYLLESLNINSWDVSQVTDMEGLFGECHGLKTLDLSSWSVHGPIRLYGVFNLCKTLQSLDISGWDTSEATSMDGLFGGANDLQEVVLGDHFVFGPALPSPHTIDDVHYTGKWIRDDGLYGPYLPAELRSVYVPAMSGKWIWEKVPTEYNITFVCNEDDYVGDMPPVTAVAAEDYVLPANTFIVFGKVFNGWTDGTRRIYRDQDTIPANTYQANDVVTLTAVFAPRDTSIVMQNGEFTFSIKGGEKAFFDGIPAGTSYSVFEENIPNDWVLIAQSNSTGLIYPLEESEALFLNKYQPDLATIQFTGRKLMDGQPAMAGSFTFELWEGNILLQTKSVIDGGFVQFDILEYDRNDVGIHAYTIKELIGDDQTLLYDGHEETIAVEVTTEEGEDNITRVHAEVTYSDGTYPDILFQNWTKPGELSLKKLVDDLLEGHEGDEFRFRITFKQENGLPLTDELTYSIEP